MDLFNHCVRETLFLRSLRLKDLAPASTTTGSEECPHTTSEDDSSAASSQPRAETLSHKTARRDADARQLHRHVSKESVEQVVKERHEKWREAHEQRRRRMQTLI